MSSGKYVRILNLLVEQTGNDKLDWKERGDESGFLVSFPDYSLLINEETERDGFPHYFISIVNSEGKIVDRFSDIALRYEGLEPDPLSIMQDPFNQARRKALRADKALDEIIAHLGSDAGR